MKVIGLDIGTTTICALVLDVDTGKVLENKTIWNHAVLKSDKKFKKLQDVNQIEEKTQLLVEELRLKWGPISAIGITGQMHGILYVDKEGLAVSPLYTWQDERGNEKCETGETYADQFQSLSGYQGATGYGLVTHYYNIKNSQVPEQAVKICTIPDYIAMKFSGRIDPVIHTTNAASLSGYDYMTKDFDKKSLTKLGIDCDILSEVVSEQRMIGHTKQGIPVAVAIGDSQASYLGSVRSKENTVAINIGTGSQISLYSGEYSASRLWESRPFVDPGYIVTASSLCGGRAYGALESFFTQVSQMLGIEKEEPCYEEMENWGLKHEISNPLEISTLFCGSRIDPFQRGSISNLSLDNFTPQHLIHGVLDGIISELYELYTKIKKQQGREFNTLVGSGNGIRKNPILREKIESIFGMKMHIPNFAEEAAFGSALFALGALGLEKDKVNDLIRYE